MPKVAFVTGSNQGLGLALVRGLCRELGDDGVVYLTARNEARGEAAVKQLEREGLRPRFHPLDVTDEDSVAAFAEYLRAEHGGVDVVLSNAAARIAKDVPQRDQVEAFVDTNNHGTYRVLKAFTPLLKEGARLVVVASSFGSLRHLDPALHGNFNVDVMSLEDVERVMDKYASVVESGEAEAQGWPEWINIPSKIGQVASVKVLARERRETFEQKDVLINAACPGLVNTEASRPWFDDMSRAQSPDEAAKDVLWLATLPPGTRQPYGELMQFRRVLPFR